MSSAGDVPRGAGKRPAFQWYPGDHRRDVAVQACSFEARALWREMLDLMHDGEPYGHLAAGGQAITADQLARIVGISRAKIRRFLDELRARNVFSVTSEGVIFSRRMVRDEHTRQVRRTSGLKGGNPALLLNQEDKQGDIAPSKHRANQKPTPSSAVAVAVAEESTSAPGGAVAKGVRSTNGTGPHRPTWLTPFLDAWRDRYGGEMPIKPNVGPLRDVCRKLGEVEALTRWRVYLADTSGNYASAARFAAAPNEWRLPARASPEDLDREKAERTRKWGMISTRRGGPLDGPEWYRRMQREAKASGADVIDYAYEHLNEPADPAEVGAS